jgi:acid phosphatase type 7
MLRVVVTALFVMTGFANAQSITPYLQASTPSSIWVSWISSSGTDSTVNYGTSSTALTSTATAPDSSTNVLATNFNWHTAQLTGLSPDTFYYYTVTTGAQTSSVNRFRTPPALGTKTGHFRVLVAGDNQIQSPARWRSLVTAARTKLEALYGTPLEASVNLMLNDGDQVDSGTTTQWQQVHFGMVNVVSANIPVQTSIGNHEGYSDTSYTNYKSLFRYDGLKYNGITSPLSPRYYAYQHASIVFIHMDTEDNSTTQANWVQSIVTAANADPSVDFIVTLQHRPYTVELYVGDTSSWIHNTIIPILAQSPKTVLNFSGHHHMYARGQTHDYPIYHMIAGGSAWDEYWGQSTEQDMDDVQKTICNWTWSILDFDLAAKKMTVDTYSEGGPLLGNGNQVGYYTSKLVDSYHRQPSLAAPSTPSLTVSAPGTITLPYTFHSSNFTTTTTETLNTTEFQIATNSAFTQVVKDVTRDFEDYYLDTGSPSYTPIDQNAGVNIKDYTIPANGLSNGTYYIRVRHRDSNVSWSSWSPAVTFAISGSTGTGTPTLGLDNSIYATVSAASPVTATYRNGPGLAKDWIGIYQKGQTPGGPASTTWAYVNTTSGNTLSNGTLSFTAALTAKKEYFAAYFTNDGYTEVATRVPFYVGPTPVLSISKAALATNEAFTISYTNAPATVSGTSSDWVGVYKMGQTPGSGAGTSTSTQWYYLASTAAAGSQAFTGLADGYYFARYFVNGGYTSIGNTITFSVGTNISSCTMANTALKYGDPVTVSYSNGPGNLKDYIGIFKANGTPGGSNPDDKLVYYIYPSTLGSVAASVTINAAIPSGSYKAALFINDSYTTASPFVNFTITDSRPFAVSPTQVTSGGMKLVWPGQAGVDYVVESSDDLANWTPVTTYHASGTGGSMLEYNATIDTQVTQRMFFRVRLQ